MQIQIDNLFIALNNANLHHITPTSFPNKNIPV